MPYDRQKSNEKIAAWSIGILAIVALILGGWRIFINVTDPFILEPPSHEFLSDEEERQQELAELQLTDTDADGLSDFDELYAYETSPYLKDSDSDNISDKDELDKGTNPNCPQGDSCTAIGTSSAANPLAQQVDPSTTDVIEGVAAQTSADASEIRQVLKNSGAPADTVDAMSDKEIMELYYETVAETGVSPIEKVNVNGSTDSDEFTPEQTNYTYQNLSSLTIEEIKALLLSVGVAQNTIDSVDDDTLRTIYDEALNEQVQLTN